ncbi:MAG: biotin/lipoyl-containing protein, partial [Fimbriimonadales bacterium]
TTYTLTSATTLGTGLIVLSDGQRHWQVAYHQTLNEVQILYRGRLYRFQRPRPVGSTTQHGSADGLLTAPMPGLITKVLVQVGDRVEAGQRLLVLEAMKMEQALYAPFEGTVRQLNAKEGEIVQEGAILVEIASPD